MDKTEEAARDINSYLGQQNRPPITVQLQKRGVKFPPATIADIKPKRRRPATSSKAGSSRSYAALNSTDSTIRSWKTSRTLERDAKILGQPVTGGNSMPSKAASKHGATKTKKRSKSSRRPAIGRSSSKKLPASSDQKAAGDKNSRVLNQKSPGEINSLAQESNKTTSRKSSVMRKKATRSAKGRLIEKETASNDSSISRDAVLKKTARAKTASSQKRKSSTKSTSSRARKDKVFIILEGDNASLVDERGLMEHLLSGHSSKVRYFEASEVEARVQIIPKK